VGGLAASGQETLTSDWAAARKREHLRVPAEPGAGAIRGIQLICDALRQGGTMTSPECLRVAPFTTRPQRGRTYPHDIVFIEQNLAMPSLDQGTGTAWGA
jgi:hypothetical protein